MAGTERHILFSVGFKEVEEKDLKPLRDSVAEKTLDVKVSAIKSANQLIKDLQQAVTTTGKTITFKAQLDLTKVNSQIATLRKTTITLKTDFAGGGATGETQSGGRGKSYTGPVPIMTQSWRSLRAGGYGGIAQDYRFKGKQLPFEVLVQGGYGEVSSNLSLSGMGRGRGIIFPSTMSRDRLQSSIRTGKGAVNAFALINSEEELYTTQRALLSQRVNEISAAVNQTNAEIKLNTSSAVQAEKAKQLALRKSIAEMNLADKRIRSQRAYQSFPVSSVLVGGSQAYQSFNAAVPPLTTRDVLAAGNRAYQISNAFDKWWSRHEVPPFIKTQPYIMTGGTFGAPSPYSYNPPPEEGSYNPNIIKQVPSKPKSWLMRPSTREGADPNRPWWAGEANKSQMPSMSKILPWAVGWTAMYSGVRTVTSEFGKAIDVIVKFNDAQSQLNRVLEDFPGLPVSKQLVMLRENAIQLGTTFGTEITEIVEIQKEWAMQGRNAIEISELTKATLLAVIASGLTIKEAFKYIVSGINQFGLGASRAIEYVDFLNNVSKKYSITAKDLGEAMSRSGAVAREAGISYQQLGGVIAALQETTQYGGERIGTGMTRFLMRYKEPKIRKTLSEVGEINVETEGGKMKDFMTVLSELAVKWDTLTEKRRIDIQMSIAGERRSDIFINMMRQFPVIMTAVADGYASMGSSLIDAEKRMQSLTNQIKLTRAEMQAWALSLGQKGAESFLTETVKGFRAFIAGLKESNELLVIFAGILPIVIFLLPTLGKAFWGIVEILKAWSKWQLIASVASGNLTSGLKTLALVASIFAMYEGYKYFQSVGEGALKAGEKVDTLVKKATEAQQQLTKAQGMLSQKEVFENAEKALEGLKQKDPSHYEERKAAFYTTIARSVGVEYDWLVKQQKPLEAAFKIFSKTEETQKNILANTVAQVEAEVKLAEAKLKSDRTVTVSGKEISYEDYLAGQAAFEKSNKGYKGLWGLGPLIQKGMSGLNEMRGMETQGKFLGDYADPLYKKIEEKTAKLQKDLDAKKAAAIAISEILKQQILLPVLDESKGVKPEDKSIKTKTTAWDLYESRLEKIIDEQKEFAAWNGIMVAKQQEVNEKLGLTSDMLGQVKDDWTKLKESGNKAEIDRVMSKYALDLEKIGVDKSDIKSAKILLKEYYDSLLNNQRIYNTQSRKLSIEREKMFEMPIKEKVGIFKAAGASDYLATLLEIGIREKQLTEIRKELGQEGKEKAELDIGNKKLEKTEMELRFSREMLDMENDRVFSLRESYALTDEQLKVIKDTRIEYENYLDPMKMALELSKNQLDYDLKILEQRKQIREEILGSISGTIKELYKGKDVGKSLTGMLEGWSNKLLDKQVKKMFAGIADTGAGWIGDIFKLFDEDSPMLEGAKKGQLILSDGIIQGAKTGAQLMADTYIEGAKIIVQAHIDGIKQGIAGSISAGGETYAQRMISLYGASTSDETYAQRMISLYGASAGGEKPTLTPASLFNKIGGWEGVGALAYMGGQTAASIIGGSTGSLIRGGLNSAVGAYGGMDILSKVMAKMGYSNQAIGSALGGGGTGFSNIPRAGLGIGAMGLGAAMPSLMAKDYQGAAYTGGGALAGSAIGSIFGPLGTMAGGALGGLIGGLFSGDDEDEDTTVTKERKTETKNLTSKIEMSNYLLKQINRNIEALRKDPELFPMASSYYYSASAHTGRMSGLNVQVLIGNEAIDNRFIRVLSNSLGAQSQMGPTGGVI